MEDKLFYLGVIFILLGTFLIFLSSFFNSFSLSGKGNINLYNKSSNLEKSNKVFIGGFIGFIPFGFSNDNNLLVVGIVFLLNIALIVFILYLFKII